MITKGKTLFLPVWALLFLSTANAFSVPFIATDLRRRSSSVPSELKVGASYDLYQEQQLQSCSHCFNYHYPNPTSAAMIIALNLPYASQQERKTLYDILGARRNDSKAEIKRKYLELAKVNHPDVPLTGNADAFAEIAAAYATLSDTTKRRHYDRSLDREEISQDFWKFADGMLQFVFVFAKIMGVVAFPVIEILLNVVVESLQDANDMSDDNMEGLPVSV